MSATVRYDDQYCPIARALDVLGDRWTLLILRELVIGDQRFTDLRRHLPGIAPTVLTHRLRSLVEQGFVTTTGHAAYTITERGRSTVPVMRALARWGMPLLEEPSDERPVRPWTAVNVAVAVYFDPVAAVGVDERYLFRVDGQDIVLSSVPGGGAPHDDARRDRRIGGAGVDRRPPGPAHHRRGRACGRAAHHGPGRRRRQPPAHLPPAVAPFISA